MGLADLFVHEDVDKGVDNGGELGQQRRRDGCLGGQEVGGAKGGQQGCHPVRQPADEVAHHHGNHHHQHAVLSAAGHR